MQQWQPRATALLLLVLLLGVTAPALAEHGEDQQMTDGTAFTLEKYEFRLAVWRAEFGVFDSLSVGTYPLLWALKAANIKFKWKAYENDKWAAAVGLTLLNVSFDDFEDDDADKTGAKLLVVPLTLAGTYKWSPKFHTSMEAIFTKVTVDNEESDQDTFRGAAAVSNGQLTATAIYLWGKVTALELQARYLLYQDVSGSGVAKVDIDSHTEAEIIGATSLDVVDVVAWSVVPTMHFAWNSLNLRLGLGYGNFNIPVVNFIVPVRGLVPEFDMFWRF